MVSPSKNYYGILCLTERNMYPEKHSTVGTPSMSMFSLPFTSWKNDPTDWPEATTVTAVLCQNALALLTATQLSFNWPLGNLFDSTVTKCLLQTSADGVSGSHSFPFLAAGARRLIAQTHFSPLVSSVLPFGVLFANTQHFGMSMLLTSRLKWQGGTVMQHVSGRARPIYAPSLWTNHFCDHNFQRSVQYKSRIIVLYPKDNFTGSWA